MKQMSGLLQQDALPNHLPSEEFDAQHPGEAVTNSSDPSVALGGTMDQFLQLLVSVENMTLLYSCGAFFPPALLSHDSPWTDTSPSNLLLPYHRKKN